MTKIDFNNKTFSLVGNSENGSVTSGTVFKFKQEGNLVTAAYQGGGITYGKIIAKLEDDILHMVYQCLTDEAELKSGKATATISFNKKNKMKLTLQWEWLGEVSETGVSEYIEN
ncbi:hypothetical protein N9954_00950 [Maribacter sp.]|nr:hypothetical protein [Maribacter sp.]